MLQNRVSHRCACVKLSARGAGKAPSWGAANLPKNVLCDMGYRNDSIAISRDTGPLGELKVYLLHWNGRKSMGWAEGAIAATSSKDTPATRRNDLFWPLSCRKKINRLGIGWNHQPLCLLVSFQSKRNKQRQSMQIWKFQGSNPLSEGAALRDCTMIHEILEST